MPIHTQADMPALNGQVALVTGATSGIGLETARVLATAGATVILAGRSAEKGMAALRTIGSTSGKAMFERFDMADLADIAAAAQRISSVHRQIDILVNNAGVMMPPQRQTTVDGFELQFGTNHLGHFALTGHLLPQLVAGKARVVMVSSNASRSGAMAFDDLQANTSYSPWRAYAQSKLANLLFMRGLQKRSDAAGWALTAVAAHPGLSATGLIASGMGTSLLPRIANAFNSLFAQSSTAGAWPSVSAAAEPGLPPLSFVGPDGWGEWRGKPVLVSLPPKATDEAAADRLWQLSEQLTGLRFAATELR